MTFIRFVVIGFLLAAAFQAAGQTTSRQQLTEADRDYQPITGKQRLKWFALSTAGPVSLGSGLFTSAIGTARNKPEEYGGSWSGFTKRYGMRLTGISTGNAMEGGLGAFWGEDPRYFRVPDQPFRWRLENAILGTVLARRSDGHYGLAFARLAAIPGNNFLSNTWRADSEANSHDAAVRTMYGFLGRMGSNVFKEFWPDIKRKIFHQK